jgi:predicted RNA-binding Zn-ribbon protein involved in translation (DUF1610 family)
MEGKLKINDVESVTGGASAPNSARPWEGFPCPRCGMAAFYPYDGGYDGWGSPSVRCNNCGKVMPVDDIVDAWAKK